MNRVAAQLEGVPSFINEAVERALTAEQQLADMRKLLGVSGQTTRAVDRVPLRPAAAAPAAADAPPAAGPAPDPKLEGWTPPTRITKKDNELAQTAALMALGLDTGFEQGL